MKRIDNQLLELIGMTKQFIHQEKEKGRNFTFKSQLPTQNSPYAFDGLMEAKANSDLSEESDLSRREHSKSMHDEGDSLRSGCSSAYSCQQLGKVSQNNKEKKAPPFQCTPYPTTDLNVDFSSSLDVQPIENRAVILDQSPRSFVLEPTATAPCRTFEEIEHTLNRIQPLHKKNKAGGITLLAFNEETALFYNKIASALVQRSVKALSLKAGEIFCWNDFLKNSEAQLILAPLADVQTGFPSLKLFIHETVVIKKIDFIPLANADEYEKEARLKHDLWNLLKKLFAA